MKNNSLSKKLASYTAIAVPFIAMSHHSEAQILYTDVNPDVTLNMCDTVALDLNNDGVMDFMLGVGKHFFNYWHACMIMEEGTASNRIAGIATSYSSSGASDDYFKLPFKLHYLELIGASNNWVSPYGFNPVEWCNGAPLPWHSQAVFNFSMASSYYTGYWNNGLADGYIGLKVNLNSQSYYGWARLVVDSDANWMILKDYAINTISDQSIGAGQCLCPPTMVPSETSESPVIVFPNPATDHFLISFPKNSSVITQLNVIDMEGRKRNVEWIKSGEGLLVNTRGLEAGIYFAQVNTGDAVYRKKVLVQR